MIYYCQYWVEKTVGSFLPRCGEILQLQEVTLVADEYVELLKLIAF